ncbi:MAG: SDR family NAD(P)-dependent oxidoreductase, partial [Frankiaceae bacterium]|nr:SDR family NAD(P)-dependent oxidoreductase [Frankiaceae bacterium]
MTLDGRVALVTGAGQGVGIGIVEALAAAGATVVVNDLFEDRAAAVAESVGGTAMAFDVTDRAGVMAAIEAIGRIDILVNNAG